MNLQVQFVSALFFSLCPVFLHLRPVHNTPGEFGNGGLTLKTHQMFSVHTTPGKFENEVSLWKRIKCFLSTLRRGNLKMKFHSENASNVFRPHYAGGIWKWSFTLKTHQMFSVHTTPGKFENEVSLWKRIKCFLSTLHRRNLKTEVSLWKRIKCFPSTLRRRRNLKMTFHSENVWIVFHHTTAEEFRNAKITGRFWFVSDQNFVRENTWLSSRHRFRKAPFSNCFPSTRRRKAGVCKSLRFEERLRKAFS